MRISDWSSDVCSSDLWMETTGFPAAGCHNDEHAAVMKSVHEVRALLAASADERALGATRSLAQALVDWFPGHATYLDSALSAWMCKRVSDGKPVVFHTNRIAIRRASRRERLYHYVWI